MTAGTTDATARLEAAQGECTRLEARRKELADALEKAKNRLVSLQERRTGLLVAVAGGLKSHADRAKNTADVEAAEREVKDATEILATVDGLLTEARQERDRAYDVREHERAGTMRTEAYAALNAARVQAHAIIPDLLRAAELLEGASRIQSSDPFVIVRSDIRQAARQIHVWFSQDAIGSLLR